MPSQTRPLVSVIVPTHNRPRFLSDALASVAAQTYRPIEIVVVNDAGISVECQVRRFSAETGIPVTYVCHSVNRGLAAARNTGIALSRGVYLGYLDDDDILLPRHVELVVSALESSGQAVAYGDTLNVVRDRGWLGRERTIFKSEYPSWEFRRDDLLKSMHMHLMCALHRRECIERVGGFDEGLRACEDWDFCIRLSQAYDFVHVPQPTAEYRIRAQGTNMTYARRQELVDGIRRLVAKHAGLSAHRPEIRAANERLIEEWSGEGRDEALRYMVWKGRQERQVLRKAIKAMLAWLRPSRVHKGESAPG